MSDKIINPSLLKPITTADYKRHNHSQVHATDVDKDGKVTHADRFQNSFTGTNANTEDRDFALQEVCGEMAPSDTHILVTDAARNILKKHHVEVDIRKKSTASGRKYDELNFIGAAIRSYGGYVASLSACHYNLTGFKILEGDNDHQVAIHYQDATGTHVQPVEFPSEKESQVKPSKSHPGAKPLPPPPGYKGIK